MCSVKKVVLKNFTNFTGKHLYWSLVLIELQAYACIVWVGIIQTDCSYKFSSHKTKRVCLVNSNPTILQDF